MVRIYIPYATGEGQTAAIAEYIADVVRGRGGEADVVDLKESRKDGVPSGYDGVIVGASIHVGKHDKKATTFVGENRDVLDRLPSAFFSVSLAAHGDEAEAERYVAEFEEKTGWRPGKVAMFAGALRYTQYGFVKRRMMRKIANAKPGALATDTSRDYVYTEWDGVRSFAEEFLDELHPQESGTR